MTKTSLKHNVYLDVAESLSTLSQCVSYQVAAVIVKDGRILSTGINGSPKGSINCNEMGWSQINGKWTPRGSAEKHHEWSLRNEIHAEMNAIIFAARNGISIEGADIYVTHEPCNQCTKNLSAAGIKNIYYRNEYPRNRDDSHLQEFIKNNELKIWRVTYNGCEDPNVKNSGS